MKTWNEVRKNIKSITEEEKAETGKWADEETKRILDNNVEKSCKIYNGQFSWVLEVDGKTIGFSGYNNVDYFEKHYKDLGYDVQVINQPNKYTSKKGDYLT